ncbi:HpcH/HpaI aldolase family protein [Salinarimonas soli]|uniref:Aldolase n=1 Tax=Salinarimonas soli TaxID=1638099 RepID=A0A5B2W0T6_9HYPH|nr:aldolase/citrate lyase family protein [Salinarimonas soli]KAA2244242.1 aldolase [Salinarimonas soli]
MTESLKQRLQAGMPTIGTFLKTPSPIVAEVLGLTGLDVLCLDAEHAPFDRGAIDLCVMACRAAGKPVLVRTPSPAAEHVLSALDIGATGVVVPHVTSADVARDLVRAAHYGPGGRGYAGSSRAARYTMRPMAEHIVGSAAETVVIAMIEDVEAVEDIEAIAAVEGIDALFVGRADLTVAFGERDPQSPVVVEAVERVCRAAQAAGRTVGMFVPRVEEVARWRPLGASLFLLDSDHGFLLKGAARLVADFRAAQGA